MSGHIFNSEYKSPWTWIWANSGRQWRMEEPGNLQSRELQRVGHNLVTEQQQQIPCGDGWIWMSQIQCICYKVIGHFSISKVLLWSWYSFNHLFIHSSDILGGQAWRLWATEEKDHQWGIENKSEVGAGNRPWVLLARWKWNSKEGGFSGGPVVRNPPAIAGYSGAVPGMGRSHMPKVY